VSGEVSGEGSGEVSGEVSLSFDEIGGPAG
jgi:hypothetical protein